MPRRPEVHGPFHSAEFEGQADDAGGLGVLAAAALTLTGLTATSATPAAAAAESGSFDVLTYNIAGLPLGLGDSDPETNTPLIGQRLGPYDIVNVQEDFNYHASLYANDKHPHRTATSGGAAFGDGLNTLSDRPFEDFQRVKWNNCTGTNCLTPKGFSLARVRLAEGVFVDLYNVQVPDEAAWEDVLKKVRDAGLPWADELGRFVATSAPRLAHWVTPSARDGLVTSHLDLQPQNVLIGADGPVLLDWDNAGPISAERELARAVYVWSGRNEVDIASARRLARAYRDAGGRAVVTGPESFSMLFATDLNYIHVQAETAVDPAVTAEQREFAGEQVVTCLRDLPDLAAVSLLVAALDT
ncbi:hypothetical protein SVIOM74S_10570 [Streptomyces violarus]